MKINSTIKVGAIFSAEGGSASGGKGMQIVPRWFVWEERKYAIKEVSYVWKDKQGIEDLHFFAVSDGTNSYELCFNSKRLTWKLNKVLDGA